MNRIVAGEYIFNISDQMCQQAFNIRTQTLHAAHIMTTKNDNNNNNNNNNNTYSNSNYQIQKNEQSVSSVDCCYQTQTPVLLVQKSNQGMSNNNSYNQNEMKWMINQMVKANERLNHEEGHLKLQNIFENEQADQVFVVYETLPKDAVTLLDLMKARNNLPELFVRKIAQLLLNHVERMHKLNVIHRDLKLPNIYVYKQNGQWKIKVKDLRLSETDAPSPNFNNHRGSPAYLAPEVTFTGKPYNGFSAEVYSVGVILYTLATGSYPFVASSPQGLIQAIRSSPLSFPQTMTPSLRGLLEKMLNKNPSERCTIEEANCHPWVLGETETDAEVGLVDHSNHQNSLAQSCTASSSAGTANTFLQPTKTAAAVY